MRGSGQGTVSGRTWRQSSRHGERTKTEAHHQHVVCLPRFLPLCGECSLKAPSFWPFPSWGPSCSGCSPVIGCPVGTTTQRNHPGAHLTKSCWQGGSPSTLSWGEYPFLIPWPWYLLGWGLHPVPELLLRSGLQRDVTPSCLLWGSPLCLHRIPASLVLSPLQVSPLPPPPPRWPSSRA